MRVKKLPTDYRELIIYKNSNDQKIETSGYIIEKRNFLHIHKDVKEGKLLEIISITKDQLISRERLHTDSYLNKIHLEQYGEIFK